MKSSTHHYFMFTKRSSKCNTYLVYLQQSRSIMALQVSSARIALAIMKQSENDIQELNPISYYEVRESCIRNSKNVNKEDIRKQLLDIAKDENVCGLVVGWPLERSGSPGFRCGKILHLLDHFAETRQEGGYLINQHSRPVVLVDERQITHGHLDDDLYQMDEWGRCEVFGKKFPLPCQDEFGNEIEHTFKTSLRSDRLTSDDSTSAISILEHFRNNYTTAESKGSKHITKNVNRCTERNAENMDHSQLQQIIESFQEDQSNTMNILPL